MSVSLAALNLAKFRKFQADLESSEERADINEQVKKIQDAGLNAFLGCWQSTRLRLVAPLLDPANFLSD